MEPGKEGSLLGANVSAVPLSPPTKPVYSNVLPFWKYALLLFSTLGLYELWWIFKTWTFLKDVNQRNDGVWSRVGSTAGTVVPVLNLFFLWKLFTGVRAAAVENDLPTRYSVKWLYLAYIVLLIVARVFDRIDDTLPPQTGQAGVCNLAITFGLLFAPLLLTYLVQQTVNDYWKKYQGDLPMKLTRGQIIIFCFGALLWACVTVMFYEIWTGQVDSNGRDVVRVFEPSR
jgi:hypothetical protein